MVSVAVIHHNCNPLPMVEFLLDRNVLMEPYPILNGDVYKVCWKAFQVQMKTVCFQWPTVPHNSADCFALCFLSVQKVVKNQSECHPHCLLSSFLNFITISDILYLLCLKNEDPFFCLCITDLWKLLYQILKTFSMSPHDLNINFHHSKFDVKWGKKYFL